MRVTGGNVLLGCLSALASSLALNMLSAPLFQALRRGHGETDVNASMVMSMGMGMIITDVLSHGFNQGLPIAFPEALSVNAAVLRIGLIRVLGGQAAALAAGVMAASAVFLILYRTRAGRAFRAIAEDPDGARMAGIPLGKTGLESFALSGLLGGIIAVLLAATLGSASSGLGEQVALKVLAVSIIAGLGNLTGGVVVGLLLGILESLAQGYLPGSWSNAVAFVAMLAVVLLKPKGLFGTRLLGG
jgi:branched-chain amino acid transport system permease protein